MSILLGSLRGGWKKVASFMPQFTPIQHIEIEKTTAFVLKKGLLFAQTVGMYKGSEWVVENLQKRIERKLVSDKWIGLSDFFAFSMKIVSCYAIAHFSHKYLGLSSNKMGIGLCMALDILFTKPKANDLFDGVLCFWVVHAAFFLIGSEIGFNRSTFTLFKNALAFACIYTIVYVYLCPLSLENAEKDNLRLIDRFLCMIGAIFFATVICKSCLKLNVQNSDYRKAFILFNARSFFLNREVDSMKWVKDNIFSPECLYELKELGRIRRSLAKNKPSPEEESLGKEGLSPLEQLYDSMSYQNRVMIESLIKLGKKIENMDDPSEFCIPSCLNEYLNSWSKMDQKRLELYGKRLSEDFFEQLNAGKSMKKTVFYCFVLSASKRRAFFLNEVLKGASSKIKEGLIDRDIDVLIFILVKVVAMSIAETDDTSAILSDYFSEKVKKEVRQLRSRIKQSRRAFKHFKRTLAELDARMAESSFENILELDHLNNQEERDLLKRLIGIGWEESKNQEWNAFIAKISDGLEYLQSST